MTSTKQICLTIVLMFVPLTAATPLLERGQLSSMATQMGGGQLSNMATQMGAGQLSNMATQMGGGQLSSMATQLEEGEEVQQMSGVEVSTRFKEGARGAAVPAQPFFEGTSDECKKYVHTVFLVCHVVRNNPLTLSRIIKLIRTMHSTIYLNINPLEPCVNFSCNFK